MVIVANRRKHHSPSWTPASLGASLWAWYDAPTQGGSNGVAVSQMTDYSGNARHLASGASKPLFSSSGLNSRSAFNFATGKSISLTLGSAFTGSALQVYFACQVSTAATGAGRLASFRSPGLDYNTKDTSIPALVSVSGGAVDLYACRDNQYPAFGTGLSNGSNHITASHFSSGSIALWLNGTAGGAASHTSGAFNFGIVELGISTFGEQFNGLIGEMIVVTGSTADRQKVEGYLAHKYGLTSNLPVSHPYKTTAP